MYRAARDKSGDTVLPRGGVQLRAGDRQAFICFSKPSSDREGGVVTGCGGWKRIAVT